MKKSLSGIYKRTRILGALLLGLVLLSFTGGHLLAAPGAGLAPAEALVTSTAAGGNANGSQISYASGTFHVPTFKATNDTGLSKSFYKGVHVVVNATARSGNTKLDVKLQQLDLVTGTWTDEPGAAVNTITSVPISEDIVIYPGIATLSTSGAAGSTGTINSTRLSDAGFGLTGYRALATLTSGGTTTYSISASYIP